MESVRAAFPRVAATGCVLGRQLEEEAEWRLAEELRPCERGGHRRGNGEAGTDLRLRGSTSTSGVGVGPLKTQPEVSGSRRQGVCSPREDQGERGHEERHEAAAMAVESGQGGTRPSEVGATLCGGPFSMVEGLGVASRNAHVNFIKKDTSP